MTDKARIVVVRDREPEALENPPRAMFGDVTDVVYHHVSSPEAIPDASHYFFNCERLTGRAQALATEVHRAGGIVTLILLSANAAVAELAGHERVNVIPAYGPDGQITAGTLAKAIRAVLVRERIVARGFIEHSLARRPVVGKPGRHEFVDLLMTASHLAEVSNVVTAVLALQRTGSKFLRDMIGLTVSGSVRVFHEHEVPPESDSGLVDASRPLFDQMILERDSTRRQAVRKAILRDALMAPDTRDVFVSERDPFDRLTSYFQVQHEETLRASFDAERGVFADLGEIQSIFDQWSARQVAGQRRWYRRTLVEPFGLDVLKTEPTGAGLFVGRNGANTLIVVPTKILNELLAAVCDEFGEQAYAPLAPNSAKARGDEALDRAVRRDVRVSPAVAASLFAIPEVAHVHGATQRQI